MDPDLQLARDCALAAGEILRAESMPNATSPGETQLVHRLAALRCESQLLCAGQSARLGSTFVE